MLRTGRRLAVILGLVVAAGCNRQDADALAKIGQLVVERAKSLPELKSPQAEKNKLPPQPDDEKEEPRTK